MSLLGDTSTLFLREMLIFKKNLRVNLIRSLIFPIIFILLLGSFGSTPKNVPIAVVNYDNGASALNFINLLQAGSAVAIVSQTTQQDATTLLSEGKIAAIVVIPTGFSSGIDKNVYVYLDNSQPQSSEVAASTVNSAAAQMGATAAASTVPGGSRSLVSVVSNYVYGASSNYLSFVVGGILVMVASFGAVFTSGFTLLSDRELGNLKAFLTTPINKFSILLSKISYGTFQSILSAYIGLAIGLLYGATIAAGVVGFLELIWIVFLVGLGFSALAIALAAQNEAAPDLRAGRADPDASAFIPGRGIRPGHAAAQLPAAGCCRKSALLRGKRGQGHNDKGVPSGKHTGVNHFDTAFLHWSDDGAGLLPIQQLQQETMMHNDYW